MVDIELGEKVQVDILDEQTSDSKVDDSRSESVNAKDDRRPDSVNAKGQVLFFNQSEGYGFIKVFEPEDIHKDVFLHISNHKSTVVREDWWLAFDLVESDKGLIAKNSRKTSAPSEGELFGTDFKY